MGENPIRELIRSLAILDSSISESQVDCLSFIKKHGPSFGLPETLVCALRDYLGKSARVRKMIEAFSDEMDGLDED